MLLPAARLLRRDLQSGRLTVMLLATTLSCAATTAVSLFVERVERALVAESSALLAADLAVVSNDPLPDDYFDLATALGLRVGRLAAMRSVVAHANQLQLVELKAAGLRYPLRGSVRISPTPFAPIQAVPHGPDPGTVWADAKLLQILDVAVGDELTIGAVRLRIAAVLVLEPDRGGDAFSIAPRLLMHLADLRSTALIMPGSRVRYTILIAGDAPVVARYRRELDLRTGHQLLDPRSARPEVRSAFTQAQRFLNLAAFSGVLLATLGVALAGLSYAEHHVHTTAVLKTLGMSQRQVWSLFLLEMTFLALVAGLCGSAIAWAVHELLLQLFLPHPAITMQAIPAWPFLHGIAIAFVALLGFGLPSLIHLARIPVVQILGLNPTSPRRFSAASALVMALAVVAIAPWHLGDAKLIGLTLAGMLGSTLLLAICAQLLVQLMARLRGRTTMTWRFGLANLSRRACLTIVQSTGVGVGIAVILLLGLIRGDLVEQWAERVPPDAPNHFLVNVQPDEVNAMQQFLASSGIADTRFYPMVRGRLTAINNREVGPDDYGEPRARRLIEREFNLSWAETMKPYNRIVSGTWWDAPRATGQFSVEEGIASTLGIELYDKLSFSAVGTEVSAIVTNLRYVDWDAFEVNFFVESTPELLRDTPATFITAFRLPNDKQPAMPELVKRFPSVTVIDVDAVLLQVRAVMDRVAQALMWVFVFALSAGVLVLAAAIQLTQRERVLESVLLKTLGAPRAFIQRALLIEFALLGAVAGIVATIGALVTAWLLADQVLHIPYRPSLLTPAVGIFSGIVSLSLIGVTVIAVTLRQSVVSVLREVG